MKKNVLNFNTKYLKTGGYSVLISCVAIAIVIIVNLFVNQLPTSFTHIDLSSGDMLSIGEDTVSLVSGLDEDITIYYISQIGAEDTYMTTILDKYKELSDKVTVTQIDPALNPGFFTGDRKDVEEQSLIVESASRTRIVDSLDIYFPGVSTEELYYYYQNYGYYPSPTGFDAESCITSAIHYVTTDILPVIYRLTGHGERTLDTTFASSLTNKSMEVKDLSLLTMTAVPEDCNTLLLVTPQKDISESEAEMILDYLKKGGKMLYISYFTYLKDHPNLDSVLSYYGMNHVEGFVCEGDSRYSFPTSPALFIPSYGTHSIVSPFVDQYYMLMAYAHGIKKTDNIRSTITFTPLLSTTGKAYAKLTDPSGTSSSTEKAEGDVEGPFDVAVAVSEMNDNGQETQIVWITTPAVLDSYYDQYSSGTNNAMVLNSFSWMIGDTESISIPTKAYENSYITLTETQSNILTTIFSIVIPVAVVAVGFVVWWRRRSK